MKISEDYFRELVDKTASLDAVSKLARCWASRVPDKLSDAERHVELYRLYTGDVGNGGHSQFFENNGRELAAQVCEALTSMASKATDEGDRTAFAALASALTEAIAGGDQDVADKVVDKAWDRDERLLRYLRSNEDSILRPERDLPPLA